MTIVPPAPDEPRRPAGPRDPGDAWVVAPTGERYWGRYGAAGLLAVDADRGVLLQHRVAWSHFGGTWGLPGGALHEGEGAIVGALRESQEEAGVPDGAVRPRFTSVLDLDIWSYTTVVADVQTPFEPVISDPESVALEWVPLDEVAERPLHPGFGRAWPMLRRLIDTRVALVVDAANVVGSVPDGWWKDRAGAARRLADRLEGFAVTGADAGRDLGLGAELSAGSSVTEWFPEVSLVVEGPAREIVESERVGSPSGRGPAPSGVGAVSIVRADAAGDDAIVAEAERLVADGAVTVGVTSDRELVARLKAAGVALVHSAGWLLRAIGDAPRRDA